MKIAVYCLGLTKTNELEDLAYAFAFTHVKGTRMNHKRVYALFTRAIMNLRIKPKQSLNREVAQHWPVPEKKRMLGPMDFMIYHWRIGPPSW